MEKKIDTKLKINRTDRNSSRDSTRSTFDVGSTTNRRTARLRGISLLFHLSLLCSSRVALRFSSRIQVAFEAGVPIDDWRDTRQTIRNIVAFERKLNR